jgi:DNA-binding response OmpR family regulator
LPKRILIVEDDAAFASLLQTFLASKGYEVQLARDGALALELAFKSKPDLVLLDLMLPGKHGFEVCETLRQRWSAQELPVLTLSSKIYDADKDGARAVGANAYMTKPCKLEDLEAKVGELLR